MRVAVALDLDPRDNPRDRVRRRSLHRGLHHTSLHMRRNWLCSLPTMSLLFACTTAACTTAANRPGGAAGGIAQDECITPTGESCVVPECDDPCAYNDPAQLAGQCVISEVPDECGDLRGIEARFFQLGATVPAPGGVFRPADPSLQKWVQARWQEMSQFVVPANVKTTLTKGGVKVWNYPDGNGWTRTDFHAGIVALPKDVSPDAVLAKLRDDPNAASVDGEFNGWVGWPKAGEGGRQLGDRVDLDIWGPDNGAIGYWKIDPDRFCVITLENDTVGIHPVNGIRCWGYVPMALNPNWLATTSGKAKWGCAGTTYMFYSMGIDSPSVAGGGAGADLQAATWNALIRDLLIENVKAGGISGYWYQQKTVTQPNDLAPGGSVQANAPGEMSSYYVSLPESGFRDGEVCMDPAAPAGECAPEEFTCIDGRCIADAARCDGVADCTDRDDEEACDGGSDEGSCAANQFACADGKCLPGEWECDGEYDDCAGGEDESDCGSSEGSECAPSEFTCSDGACIPGDWKCDAIADCSDEGDEAACAPTDDAPADDEPAADEPCDGYTCFDGSCVPPGWICDDIVDCTDGDDEQDCAEAPADDAPAACDGFACDDGTCIWAEWQCDAYVDCDGGEDEADC